MQLFSFLINPIISNMLIDPITDELTTNERRQAIYRNLRGTPMDEEYKRTCISNIKDLYKKVESKKGREARALAVIDLFKYIIKNIPFVAGFSNRFRNAVIEKAKELLLEDSFNDDQIDEQFRAVLQDTIFIYDE